MASCAGIKADGGRCRGQAIRGIEYCFSHSPAHAEARKQRARKGGKRGGRGRPGVGLLELKRDVRQLIDDVLDGSIRPGLGAVALQGYNTLLRAAKVELDIREQTELIGRLEALEQAAEGQRRGGRRWGG